jgi:hypothetical protein
MITEGVTNCPRCGGRLKHYDKTSRLVRTKGGQAKWIKIRRLRCIVCNALHRELPKFILPYKHYEASIIEGVLNGLITSETIECEDYPCEVTMLRWSRK